MAIDIKGILINMILPILLGQAREELGKWLDQLKITEPEWHDTIVICAHRLLSVHGGELAASTTNPYDDAAIKSAVEELEQDALKYGIELQIA